MQYKSARGLMAWFTLFFIWSAFVLWYHGVALLQFIMHDSNFYAFSLALRQTRSDMLPDALRHPINFENPSSDMINFERYF